MARTQSFRHVEKRDTRAHTHAQIQPPIHRILHKQQLRRGTDHAHNWAASKAQQPTHIKTGREREVARFDKKHLHDKEVGVVVNTQHAHTNTTLVVASGTT